MRLIFHNTYTEKEKRDEVAAIDACIDGNAIAVRRIFGHDGPDRSLCHGQRPIHLAAAAGNLVAIETLWSLGASLDTVGDHVSANAALHLAVLAQQHAALALLLHLGAKVDVENGVKTAPLQDAARLNDTAAGRMLLTAGADPTRQNGYGNTVLHRVCYFGHDAWMTWLSRAISPTAWTKLAALKNAAGLNAIDVAISHERWKMEEFLTTRGLQPSKPRNRLRGLRYSERRQWLELLGSSNGVPSVPSAASSA